MQITITRSDFDKYGTYGFLSAGKFPTLLTLELPWRDNQFQVSAIPKGEYLLKRVISPKFGQTYEVMDVPHRSEILFHKGNYLGDTNGCILVGEGILNGDTAFGIAYSANAFRRLMAILKGHDTATLVIR